MIVDLADGIERLALWPARAEYWRGAMSVSQYNERNIRLFSHPYGKRIRTWVVKNESGEIKTSFDALPIELLSENRRMAGILIASVFTLPVHRGLDYARRAISMVLVNEAKPSVLFSDLAPEYYEAIGFVDMPIRSIEVKGRKASRASGDERSVDCDTFLKALNEGKSIALKPGEATEIYSEEHLDWNIERFRYFAELAGKRLPEDLYWLAEHAEEAHVILSVPNYMTGKLEGLVANASCRVCVDFLRGQAHKHGLASVHYWQTDRNGNTHPMVRPGQWPCGQWVDQQPLDYW